MSDLAQVTPDIATPEHCELVTTAALFRPAAGQSDEHRDAVLARMMRHATRTMAGVEPGSQDGDDPGLSVMDGPCGKGARLADVEALTPQRAEAAMMRAQAVLADRRGAVRGC